MIGLMPEASRHFIDWAEPLLPRAAAWLLERAPKDPIGRDLSDVLVVVPGGRASRLLTGFLVDLAEERSEAVAPPETTTPRGMVDRLAGSGGRDAPEIARLLAWSRALLEASEEEVVGLWGRRLESEAVRRRFAKMIGSLSDELAQARLRLGDVEARLGDAPPEEAPRWRVLGSLQRRYEARLLEGDLVDPLLSAMDRVERGEFSAGTARLVLVGVTELTPLERGAIVASGATVETVTHAPETMSGRFDGLGCVHVDAWTDAEIELSEDRIVFAEDPRDESERALAHVASLGDPVEASRVVIGSPDAESLGVIRRLAAETAGGRIRVAPGDPASLTLPGRLLALLEAHARESSFDTFLALLRHPDVEQAATAGASGRAGTERWLERLDEIRHENVLRRVDAAPEGLPERRASALREARAQMESLFGDLVSRPGERRSLARWSDRIREALVNVYGDEELRSDDDDDRRVMEVMRAVDAALEELSDAGGGEEGSAADALELVMERLDGTPIPESPSADAIEGLGWLELATDPSPHAVVIGMTDDCAPGGRASDPLLPDSRRAPLGLVDARARAARDAYLTTALAASRDVVFMAPRRTAQGEPARASRLLFRTGGARLARRVRRFTEDELTAAPRIASRLEVGVTDGYRASPRVGEGYVAPDSLRVTDFGAFLRSPAAWYLERMLRLEDVEAPPREMSPRSFGSLAHRALELFGRDETYRRLTDAAAVAEALSKLLDHAASETFGPRPAAAVSLQRELLRRRLGFLAGHLAKRRREGWEVLHVEWEAGHGEQGVLDVDGVGVRLRGKIDLIEARDEEWAILDFKTSSDAKAPEKTHWRKSKGWVDLQLPLYRHVVRSLDPPEMIRTGLAYVPTSEDAPAVQMAGWDAETLAEADEAARDVVREMRRLAPGSPLVTGDHPPERGALGFVTGVRFEASVEEDEGGEA